MCKKISQLLSLFFTGIQFSLPFQAFSWKILSLSVISRPVARVIFAPISLHYSKSKSSPPLLQDSPNILPTSPSSHACSHPFQLAHQVILPENWWWEQFKIEKIENRVNFDATVEDCAIGHDLWKGEWLDGWGTTIEPIPGRGDWLHSTFFTFFKDSYERRVSGLIYHHKVAGHDQDHGSWAPWTATKSAENNKRVANAMKSGRDQSGFGRWVAGQRV